MLVILSGASRSFIVRGVVEEPAVRDLNLCNELQRHHTSGLISHHSHRESG
jgi:hypothetical protein